MKAGPAPGRGLITDSHEVILEVMKSEEDKDKEFRDGTDPADKDSDYIKKKYFYRTLIVKGQARVKNRGTTRRLVGPDCAYHLYSYQKKETSDSDK